ncbi:uncharacterized protein CLUP02_10415 [Colletotrichum lupini]|uniref:Uncharacterized protein n=3 Tax=Colletotrichum acutatum species complex TaxID=2707335 RepID=A0A9Q8SWP8_9PEZI|nr:uncharacterized protein CLUP02_10415 [Colletotrichum lupini]XP_060316017.1 uncharacterized protein CCOS01_06073 [Colletotrichum costaricense]KAI3534456.1 hypothetical protein CSPX01_12073 [Colletotrichum filicis]KAK1465261.1 hypothetical protein CCUS01_07666 [Colletotrichum cuscutae]KAK1530970.1 hypothetical protein CCOS01_06073 [Colletotrichum costaricense]UQC84919.1 hypothetical protein CLUP02_10415 [Colletotrichum lupini]
MIHHCRCDTTPSSIRATLSHPMLPVTTPSTHLDIPACSSPVLKRGGRFPWANRKSHIRSPGMPTTDRPPATTSARIALTTALTTCSSSCRPIFHILPRTGTGTVSP